MRELCEHMPYVRDLSKLQLWKKASLGIWYKTISKSQSVTTGIWDNVGTTRMAMTAEVVQHTLKTHSLGWKQMTKPKDSQMPLLITSGRQMNHQSRHS